MNKKSRLQKIIIYMVILISVIVAIYFVYLGWLSRSLNFQAYAPTKLQPGIVVINHKTGIVIAPGQKFKEVTINTNSSNLYIGEEKSTYQEYLLTTHSCNRRATNVVCVTLKSQKGQQYSVSTSYNSGKSFSQIVSWQKDKTRFWIDLKKDQLNKYSDESWGNIIDNFMPTNYGEQKGEVVRTHGA